MTDWRDNLIETDEGLRALLAGVRRVAVLGIKPESRPSQPAYFVPAYLREAGLEVIPVPVYYPEVQTILGERVYRRVQDVPGPIDLVDVFRRPKDIEPHVEDLLVAAPGAVWLQSGIRHAAAAEELARAGIKVVQDRCLMVDHRRLAAR